MKLKLEIDDKGLRRGFGDFKSANKIAIRKTLDTAAALTRRNAVKNIKDDFILRNSWTTRNIQFDKVKTNDIKKMKSEIGATKKASYMKTQHHGGTRPKKGAVTAIPQKKARLGNSHRKVVQRSKYISKIGPRIVSGASAVNRGSHKAYSVAQMAVAFKKKLFLKRNDNIYFVSSFVATGGRVKAKLERIYFTEKGNINLSSEKWLHPSATRRPSENFSKIYRGQLRKLWKYDAFK